MDPVLPVAAPLPAAVVALQTPGTRTFRLVAPGDACLSPFDRSFHFGDSLYEVARTYQGILFSFADHLRRLHASAQLADFGQLPEDDLLASMVDAACRAFFTQFGNTDVYVRVTVSRGLGDVNIDRHTAGPPYALVIVKALGSAPDPRRGAHWALVTRRRNLRSALDPAMKSGNYLNNVLALAEAQAQGAEDALMLDHQGWVTEGTTSNFYAVRNGTVLTAPLSVGILAGVTRAWVLQLCANMAIPLQERLFTANELTDCSELFLSSSTREVQAITALNGVPVAGGLPGPVTTRLQQGMRDLVGQFVTANRAHSLFTC